MNSEGISSLIVKLTAPCNLNCSYCYLYQHADQSWKTRPKQMSDAVYERMLEAVRSYCDAREGRTFSLVFHGGEPTLVGAERFDQLARRARQTLGKRLRRMSLQTNGTLIDEGWVRVLKRHRMHVGISLDGPRPVHDAARVTHAGAGSYDKVLEGLRRLEAGGVDCGVLCVVNPGQSGEAIYRHFRELGLERMNFLLPDVSHDGKARFYGAFGKTPVADYLIPCFDAWFDEDNPRVQVPLFWSLLRQLRHGRAPLNDAFGNPPMGYLVVDTDGSIEALDALRVCAEGIASSGLNVMSDGFDDLHRASPLVHQAMTTGFGLPTACGACPERETCAGGYLPHRYSAAAAFDNPSVWCADILAVLGHIRSRVAEADAA
jgi:uncharacterized protein